MITVNIAELRNNLSTYLKKVRHGAQLIISDRETPIGRLLPYQANAEESFELSTPPKGYSGLAKIKYQAAAKNYHVTEDLLAERRKR